MTDELEGIAVDSLGGWLRFRHKKEHSTPLGSPCANCGEAMQGPWCHACGQSGEDFHRSIRLLAGEVFENLFHFDGRLWRTLPDLTLRPDRLTKNYLAGHRVPQIPPLRLFLVALLLVFITGSISGNVYVVAKIDNKGRIVTSQPLDKETTAELADATQQIQSQLPMQAIRAFEASKGWLAVRMKAAFGDPERFLLILESWGERFAFLSLPLATLLLSLLFATERKFYMFDHAIFSLHSLSALGLLLSLVFVLDRVTGGNGGWLLLAAPIHLFRHMRGVYGTTVSGTLVRMGLLFAGSVVGFGLIVTALLAVGLYGMG